MYAAETILRNIELAGDKKGVRRLHGAQGVDLGLWRSVFGELTTFDLVREGKR